MIGARSRPALALVVAVIAAAGLAFTYVVAVRTPGGQFIDTSIMVEVSQALAGQSWTGTLLAFISPITVLALTGLLVGLAWVGQGTRAACTVLAATAVTIASATVLKAALTRPGYLDTAANSLPSGHVAAVAGLAAAATFAVAPRYRRAARILGSTLTGLTGVATLAHQWHRPSDVIAASLLAIIVVAIIDSLAPDSRVAPPLSREVVATDFAAARR